MLNLIIYAIYPCIFEAIFHGGIAIFIFALLHSIFSGLALSYIFASIQRKNIFTISDIFIISNLIYFYLSSIKYYEIQLYPDFIVDNYLRFSSVIIGITILIFCYYIKNKFLAVNIKITKAIDIRRYRFTSLWIILAIFLLIKIYEQVLIGIGSMYIGHEEMKLIAIEKTSMSPLQKIYEFLQENFIGIFAIASIFLYRKKSNIYVLLITLMLTLAYSIVLGSRYIIYSTILSMAFTAIAIEKLRPKILCRWLIASPLIMSILTALVLITSGRLVGFNFDDLRLQLAYRFDLTDFAITISENENIIKFNIKLFLDAIYYAMPFVDYKFKESLMTGEYGQGLLQMGLSDTLDYTDNFYSMGVQLMGIAGFIIWPLIYVIFLEIVAKILKLLFSNSYKYIIYFLFPLVIRIESDLNSLFGYWRILILYIIFGIILYKYFLYKSQPLKINNNVRIL